MNLNLVRRSDGLFEALDDETLQAVKKIPVCWIVTAEYSEEPEKQRTILQCRALHKYFDLTGKKLNEAGFELKKFFEVKTVDIPWNKDLVKELIWRPVQTAMTGNNSTAACNTGEYSRIYNVVSRHISENFGVYVPWPNKRGDGF